MNRNWTNDTHKLLGDATRNAPQGLLGDIKKEMTHRGLRPAYGQPKTHVVHLGWRRLTAVAATVAVVAGLSVCLMPHDHHADLQSVALRTHQTTPGHQLRSSVDEDRGASADAPLTTALAAVRDWMENANAAARQTAQTQQRLVAVAPEAATEPALAVASASAGERPVAVAAGEAQEQAPAEMRGKKMSKTVPQRKVEAQSAEMALPPAGCYGRPVQVAAHVAGMPTNNLNSVAGDQYMKLYDAALFGPNSGEQGSSALSGLAHAKVPGVKAKHYQPIRVGVSVRVPIGSRWSLQTGVNYSYLKSEFKDAVRPKEVVGTQQLHYLGVPVSVNYDVWNTRRFNVYATAGGEVEQLVKGTYKSDAGQEGVKEHRPVMSVNAAAGAALKLSPSISVYAEPGLSYHFKNGSGVESAYTDRPLGFSLNVGLRWSTK